MTDDNQSPTMTTNAIRRHPGVDVIDAGVRANRGQSDGPLRPLSWGATDLTVEVSVVEGTATIVLRGELDRATAPDFWSCYRSVRGRSVERVVVDVAELAFLDTSGLAKVADAADELRSGGGDLVLAGSSPMTRKILSVTGLGAHLTVAGASAEAGR